MDERIRDIGQRVRRELETQYGPAVNTIILYGSHARRTADEESDVGLLVVVDDEVKPGNAPRTPHGQEERDEHHPHSS